jgi:hypothetical protein
MAMSELNMPEKLNMGLARLSGPGFLDGASAFRALIDRASVRGKPAAMPDRGFSHAPNGVQERLTRDFAPEPIPTDPVRLVT